MAEPTTPLRQLLANAAIAASLRACRKIGPGFVYRVVTGPDVKPMRFKSRREARDWCAQHHPGSPQNSDQNRRGATPCEGGGGRGLGVMTDGLEYPRLQRGSP
jgi:hypothetical protein